ncbi:hypothetical protein BJY00DRAFT_184799 [Aspergillus carlsbadensis]|nr:hypothetical protein BJY00DRAFT_184799 [Aspergillus carlsbadensis]
MFNELRLTCRPVCRLGNMENAALQPDGTFLTSHRVALYFLDGKMSKTDPNHELLAEVLRIAPNQHTTRPWDSLLVPLAKFLIGCYTSNRAVFEEATARKTFITSGGVKKLMQRIWPGALTNAGVQALEPQQPQDVWEDPGPNARLTRRQTLNNLIVRPRQLIRRMTGQR